MRQFSPINQLFLLITLLFSAFQLSAQQPAGGGPVEFPVMECISPEQSAAIETTLRNNIDQLINSGVISAVDPEQKVITKFSWPLKQANGFDQFDYYTTTNFLDLDLTNNIQDYNCGQRSYDGHNGIDFSLWPYWWKMMEADQVEVIAGAPGVITYKQDGQFDMNCNCQGNWNAVYVRHDDGSIAWYGHLKKNSLLDKSVGDVVVEGEYLGIVGSSGCSSNPHLHFEIRDQNMNPIEPNIGSCNGTTQETWWQEPKEYYEPGLNLLMTHGSEPSISGFCPGDENPEIKTAFDLNSTIYFGAYYHDQIAGDITEYSILTPSGDVYVDWIHSTTEYYSSSWWYWLYQFPSNSPIGEWTFEAKLLGNTFSHKFSIGM